MVTHENAPFYGARLSAEQLRAACCSDETDFQRCEVFIEDSLNCTRKEGTLGARYLLASLPAELPDYVYAGVFLGGHEQDYFFKCTSSCCSQKPETFCWEKGCIFTGARFEKHGGQLVFG